MQFSSPCAIKWNYGRNFVMPVIFLRKRSPPLPVLIIVRQSDQEAELSRAASNYVAEFVNGNSIGTVKFPEIAVPSMYPRLLVCFNGRCPSPALLDQQRIKRVAVALTRPLWKFRLCHLSFWALRPCDAVDARRARCSLHAQSAKRIVASGKNSRNSDAMRGSC